MLYLTGGSHQEFINKKYKITDSLSSGKILISLKKGALLVYSLAYEE